MANKSTNIAKGNLPKKFNVMVNPFEKRAVISTKIKGTEYSVEMIYDEPDEWNAFELQGNTFDIHFHYDETFTVSIYPVDGKTNETDHQKPYPVALKIKLTSDNIDDKGNWINK